jgi:hypothetical protein
MVRLMMLALVQAFDLGMGMGLLKGMMMRVLRLLGLKTSLRSEWFL